MNPEIIALFTMSMLLLLCANYLFLQFALIQLKDNAKYFADEVKNNIFYGIIFLITLNLKSNGYLIILSNIIMIIISILYIIGSFIKVIIFVRGIIEFFQIPKNRRMGFELFLLIIAPILDIISTLIFIYFTIAAILPQ